MATTPAAERTHPEQHATLRDNLLRCLVDGERFLDRFAVRPFEGRVVLIDNELDERMLRRWLRDQGIRNTERVSVLPLRGKVETFDILDPGTRSRWVEQFRQSGASIVLFDCLRPVLDALGLSEDKDAGRFLVAFDALLDEANVSEGLIVHHMGHGGERSRGDTRLRDWPDVEWQLVRDGKPGEPQADARALLQGLRPRRRRAGGPAGLRRGHPAAHPRGWHAPGGRRPGAGR